MELEVIQLLTKVFLVSNHSLFKDLKSIKYLEMSHYTLELAMEVTDDLRILFDFMLPVILLYGPERQQFKRLRENATVNNQASESNTLLINIDGQGC